MDFGSNEMQAITRQSMRLLASSSSSFRSTFLAFTLIMHDLSEELVRACESIQKLTHTEYTAYDYEKEPFAQRALLRCLPVAAMKMFTLSKL